jgi:hypothetical protein
MGGTRATTSHKLQHNPAAVKAQRNACHGDWFCAPADDPVKIAAAKAMAARPVYLSRHDRRALAKLQGCIDGKESQ